MTATDPPLLTAPAGACDTHMHIYEPGYPMAPTALLEAPYAPLSDYIRVRERLGLTRTVVVQPTTYGIDNRCTLEAMRKLGENARGVVVVDSDVTDAELQHLSMKGVRGIRFHMLPGGALPWEILFEMAARVANFGWHVQLQLDGRELPERESLIRSLPAALVIDHTGKFLEPVAPDHVAFKVLRGLVADGAWVKLSAPYETSHTGAPLFNDIAALVRVLVRDAPERMLWASNWPHPGQVPRPDDAMLLDTLLAWVADESTRIRILVDNPAVLYNF